MAGQQLIAWVLYVYGEKRTAREGINTDLPVATPVPGPPYKKAAPAGRSDGTQRVQAMKKKAKKQKQQKEQWMDALAILAFALQVVEFGMEVWDKRKESQKAT
jgi:hypothetical protein